MKGVLEGDFDFETQGVEADDLGGRKGKVGGHEDQAAAVGMDDGDKTHEAAGGTPEQIAGGPLEGDIVFTVGGAGHRLECGVEQIA